MLRVRNDSKQNTQVLRDAHRELNQTEQNAMDIEENLYEQRTVIQKIKANLIAGNTDTFFNSDGIAVTPILPNTFLEDTS